MAGGKGTRLRPYTNILPKPLLPLGLRSILDINIRQLVASKIDNIIIAVGYLGELIENVIGDGDKYGIDIMYSYEEKPLGTVGALSLISDQLSADFIVMNGDILHNVNLKGLLRQHITNTASVTITTYRQLHKVRLGVLETEGDSIVNYIEKPTQEYKVSMGIYLINKSIVDAYVSNNVPLDFPELINCLIKDKKSISSFSHDGLWIDLGTPEEYMNVIDRLNDIQIKYPDIPIALK